jgi:type IV pilus assembly protein PilN
MIAFNLLPYREALRLRKRQEFLATVLMAGLLGLFLAVPTNMVLEYFLEQEKLKTQLLKQEIAALDKKIVEVADFEIEISSLESRRRAVENLQSERNMPVNILADLTRLMPDGAYLTSMGQEKDRIKLVGIAQSNQRVSDLLKNFETKGEWIASPDLIEISALGQESNSNNQPSTVQFTMYVKQKNKPGDAGLAPPVPNR